MPTPDYSFDPRRLDLAWIRQSVKSTPWGRDRAEADIDHALRRSTVCGAYVATRQVGFVRVVTDQRFFAYIGDLYVAEKYRRRGIGSGLIELIKEHPDCACVRNWMVTTRGAIRFFSKFGFRSIDETTNLVVTGDRFVKIGAN